MRALLIARLPSPLRDLLRDLGCSDIRVTSSANEAVRTAKAISLDLVLVDLDVLDREAPRICRSLVHAAPGAPIVTTGDGDEATVELAIDAGAHDHVSKPLRAREASARLRGALRLRAERVRQREGLERHVADAPRDPDAARSATIAAPYVFLTDPAQVRRAPRFLESRRIDARWARIAAIAGDYGRVQLLARSVAELASTSGFRDLAQLAVNLERVARVGKGTSILTAVDALVTYLEHVQVVQGSVAGELPAGR